MKLKELQKRLQNISAPDCDLLQLNSAQLHSNNAEISATEIEMKSKVGCGFFLCRLPQIFYSVKHSQSLSKKDKTLLGWFCILKSQTKSDRLKFENYSHIAKQFNISKGQVSKILKSLSNKGLIKIEIKPFIIHIVLVSWKKAIQIFLNKELKRQNIKFIELKIERTNKQVVSNFLKQFYQLQIKQYKKAQEFHIKRKIINYAVADKYFLDKENKLKKILSIADSNKRGAALCKYSKKINEISYKYLRKKYRYTLSEKELKNYSNKLFNSTITSFVYDTELKQDNFCVILTSRNTGKLLNLSNTRANQLLNEFDFVTYIFDLEKSFTDSIQFKKYWKLSNWYQLSKRKLYGRLY